MTLVETLEAGLGDGDGLLIGRAEECRALDLLRDEVKAGRSATLVLEGEPGMGKSSLLRYLADAARDEFRICEVVGVESEMDWDYAGLHQLCRPLLDELDALPEPQRLALQVAFGREEGPVPDRLQVGLGTLSLLSRVAESGPLLCLVDDPQWLDHATGRALGFVARRLDSESVAMVFAVRAGRGQMCFAGMPEMRLGGIAPHHARELLNTVWPGLLDDGLRERIVSETRGNPLALLELPRGLTSAELAGGFDLPSPEALAGQIENSFAVRVRSLPRPTRQLMLLAAADGFGDSHVVWKAARTFGIEAGDAEPAVAERLLDTSTYLRFMHPLVRSAVYHLSTAEDRREVHSALAEAIDPVWQPERRIWHLANATVGPDAAIASELERCADITGARGGFASAGTLLERSASLTADRDLRVERRLRASQAHLQAGSFDQANALLAAAEAEASEEAAIARVCLLRGLISAATSHGREAPRQLLQAARRFEPVDPAMARRTYLDAWRAAMFAGHLAEDGGDLLTVSRDALVATHAAQESGPFDALLAGLATLADEGRAAAADALAVAIDRALEDGTDDDWLQWGTLVSWAAAAIWDLETWEAASARQEALARRVGGIPAMSFALNCRSMVLTWCGNLRAAEACVREVETIRQATGASLGSLGAMLLSAYRGNGAGASALITTRMKEAVDRGDGLSVDLARWAGAILNNGTSCYEDALELAHPADPASPNLHVRIWMLPERIEAAVRVGKIDEAQESLAEFRSSANAETGGWGRGIEARCRAMLEQGQRAEALYKDALNELRATPARAELARTHLVYGEWLRRENRRTEAVDELRAAYEIFQAMGAEGFTDRARRELIVAGGEMAEQTEAIPAGLTAQEAHIAALARDGATNVEIARQLYLSARTVEWHLGKVFAKLGVTSRRELRTALST